MPEQVAASTRVRALVEPASVAVVGGSPTNPVSSAAVRNFTAMGFDGQVAAVNRRYQEVLGFPCAPSLRELDFVPEAIVVSVNRDRVLGVLEEAAEIGTAAAVVFGIGFAEIGPSGAARQEQLKRIAADSGMAVLGPNCQGLINFARSTALYMDDVKPYRAGAAGLIAQSGSIATALINNQRGVRWRYAFSTGNEAVVTAADLLSYMVEDDECRAACVFCEAIRDPDAFFDACDRALARDLPVIVLKTGKTEASARAAQAHSGALAVPDRLVDARFERHGVIRVQTLEEMLETAKALQARQRPVRGAVATMTASGGQIEMVLEGCEDRALEHVALEPATISAIDAILPDFLVAGNPLDYWGVEDEQSAYPALTRLIADDPNVEIVMAAVDETDDPTGDGRFQRQFDTALEFAPRDDKLFVLLECLGGVTPVARLDEATDAGVLLVSGFDCGLRALGHLVAHSRRLQSPRRQRAAVVDATAGEDLPDMRPFSGTTALEYLAVSGVPVAPTRVVGDVDAALAAAAELGFPVVAKLADQHVTHKTEAGGVVTGLTDEQALRAAVARLAASGHRELLIQHQLQGVELIFGVTRHAELGGFLVVGLGGIWTEVLHEVAIVPIGLAEGEALALLGQLRGHELLDGARGTPPVDKVALAALLERLDDLALRLGDGLASIDVNPVIAAPEGAWAVDALIVPADGATIADTEAARIA